MAQGRMVMNMKGFYSVIAISVMVFYMAVVLFFFIYAVMVRLLPTPIKVPTSNRPRPGTILRTR
jgi:hypothetical protein